MKQQTYLVTVEVQDHDADLLLGSGIAIGRAMAARFEGTAVRVVSVHPAVEIPAYIRG